MIKKSLGVRKKFWNMKMYWYDNYFNKHQEENTDVLLMSINFVYPLFFHMYISDFSPILKISQKKIVAMTYAPTLVNKHNIYITFIF